MLESGSACGFTALSGPANSQTSFRPSLRNLRSAEPAAAEDEVAVVEYGGLAGGDGALRGVERHARDGGIERLDCGRRRFVLVADFGEGTERGGLRLVGNPIHAFDFAHCLSENIVFADEDAVLLRIN